MIDWHSHILPQVDDGSQSVKESIAMLDLLSEQGVKCVVATPHFLANEETIESFLKRRKDSYDALLKSVKSTHPRIFLGAEVKYYPGIARMDNLESLAIENTKILLLEMPMSKWTEYTVKELIEITGTRRLKLILAHIERYITLQKKEVWKTLYENGIYMQVNASFFDRVWSRRKAFGLLDSGAIHFIGSDCHNLTSRPPNLVSAYSLIDKKFGTDYVIQMNGFGEKVLGHKFK